MEHGRMGTAVFNQVTLTGKGGKLGVMVISQNKSVIVWGEETIPLSYNKCVVNIADAVGTHSYLLSIYFHELRFAIASSHYSLPE